MLMDISLLDKYTATEKKNIYSFPSKAFGKVQKNIIIKFERKFCELCDELAIKSKCTNGKRHKKVLRII